MDRKLIFRAWDDTTKANKDGQRMNSEAFTDPFHLIILFHRTNCLHREPAKKGSPKSTVQVDLQGEWTTTAYGVLVQGQPTDHKESPQIQASS